MLRWLLAAVHLLALGIGLGASRAGRFARTSVIQAGLIILTVLAATAMARGHGASS